MPAAGFPASSTAGPGDAANGGLRAGIAGRLPGAGPVIGVPTTSRGRLTGCLLALLAACAPAPALAWGYEGHEVVAAIARSYLTPDVRRTVDAMLAADPDTLTARDMLSRATWADSWRSHEHPETASWHFVDLELDAPDLRTACFGFPPSAHPASAGPAQDCVVDKVDAFAAELADLATPAPERLLALKYLLHFVGDLHQPLHASDNHDKGGNCVRIALGGRRTGTLHGYWDTIVVEEQGTDPQQLADQLIGAITLVDKAAWEQGDAASWAMEAFGVARTVAYRLGSQPGCGQDMAPIPLPPGYDAAARIAAARQLEKAGVRLALLLNRALLAAPPPG